MLQEGDWCAIGTLLELYKNLVLQETLTGMDDRKQTGVMQELHKNLVVQECNRGGTGTV